MRKTDREGLRSQIHLGETLIETGDGGEEYDGVDNLEVREPCSSLSGGDEAGVSVVIGCQKRRQIEVRAPPTSYMIHARPYSMPLHAYCRGHEQIGNIWTHVWSRNPNWRRRGGVGAPERQACADALGGRRHRMAHNGESLCGPDRRGSCDRA
jgi:hypothetical protein